VIDYDKYFSFLSILPAILWIIIFLSVGFIKRNNNSDLEHYRYYLPNLYAKLGFSIAFALAYLLVLGGGDTIAYYDGAVTMNNLFFKSPSLYFEEMINLPNVDTIRYHFDSSTGYPPGWIYREPEAWFVSKVMSIFSFLTLKSYLAMTVIMGFFTAQATWKLYEFVRHYRLNNDKILAFAVLFLPSLNFWCSGVSKDTVVFIALCVLVINVFKLLSKETPKHFGNYMAILLSAFVIFKIRSFILLAFGVPLSFAVMTRAIHYFGGGNVMVMLVRTIIILAGFIVVGQSMITQSEKDFVSGNTFVQQAAIIQDDFEKNQTYGDKKYKLDVTFTPTGLLRAAPLTIITGIYRPFIWEALSPTLLFNGLESLLFIYFTFLFFRKNLFQKISLVRNHEFLIFCFIFAVLVAFMTGLTSILFGVLVRLRSPLLPFLFILLTVDWNQVSEQLKLKKR
jgi:hypothetical protein